MEIRPRSVLHYALKMQNITPIRALGGGKSADAALGEASGRLFVVRTTRAPPFDVKERFYTDTARRLLQSHQRIKNAMRDRIPRLFDTFVVRNTRGKPIGTASVMEFVDGPTLADVLRRRSLTEKEETDLVRLLRFLWRSKHAHHDLTGGNVVWNKLRHKFQLIDLDMASREASPNAARAKDLPMLQSALGDLPPRLIRHVAEMNL